MTRSHTWPVVRSLALLPLGLALLADLPAQAAASSYGHARTREAAALGRLPTPLEVAVADIVNYHRHVLPAPRAGQAVALDLRTGAATARPGGQVILQIGMTTAPPSDRADHPPVNLALVIDCSGSMAADGKIGHVREGLHKLAERLSPTDRVAIIAYSTEASVVAASRPYGDGAWYRRAVDELRTGGSTNLDGGLQLGLREVSREMSAGGSNRVILLTDGIANVGETRPDAILRASRAYTSEGVDLTTIGVGEDLNNELLDRLARGGRGLFHYVADGADLSKVFVQEVDMLLTPVARDAELVVQLPRGLLLEQVYGHEWRPVRGGREDREANEIAIALPDMNAGMTAVVMIRCRCRHDLRPGDTLRAEARLRATSALPQPWSEDRPERARRGGRDIREFATASLRVQERAGDPLADVVVRKNHTIATLAQGMHDMARAAAELRWAEADRALRPALSAARERYPHREDRDVAAVLEMAEAHSRLLQRHLDRFGGHD